MTDSPFRVGSFVCVASTSPRDLVHHSKLMAAYADSDVAEDREAYLSHFKFDAEMLARSKANRNSVAEFAGPSATRWVILDIDQLRFGVDEGDRHQTLFRSAAWRTVQGAPPSLGFALLTEAGRDVGLTPADVARQIRCGMEHDLNQRQTEGGQSS